MSEPSIARLQAVAKAHRPRGWKVVERPTTPTLEGQACPYAKRITCPPIVTRYALAIFLHECGHIHLGHVYDGEDKMPSWLHEYEAEVWAITAMRKAGISVPQEILELARENVQNELARDHLGDHPAKVLKFAYGRNWRKFR